LDSSRPPTAFRHDGAIIWLTGLPAAGKTTLAQGASRLLDGAGYRTYVIDGDVLRAGLNSDLGFSHRDRAESVRRAGEVACMFADANVICIVALISPAAEGRAAVRARAGERFHEIYVATPATTCEARDPKGLYSLARRGLIADFTGVSAPYEPPTHPELIIDTSGQSPDRSVSTLVDYVRRAVPLNTHIPAPS
jgi:adenylyl-sulfate kinase